MWTIISAFTKILNIIFPAQCYGCGVSDVSVCNTCLNSCSKSVDYISQSNLSLYSFKDPLIKQIIRASKYYHRRDLLIPLAEKLAEEVEKEILRKNDKEYTLVPIPMQKLRKYMRGYNQAELIALVLSKKLSLICRNNILIRIKSTKRQVVARTRSERLKNQLNSFLVVSDVKNKNIILVDDVRTTGATIDEARRVLLKNGARSVYAVTLAH